MCDRLLLAPQRAQYTNFGGLTSGFTSSNAHGQEFSSHQFYPPPPPRQQQPTQPYFAHNPLTSLALPTPYYFPEASSSTLYDYPTSTSQYYAPSQPHRPPSNFHPYRLDASGSTTPLITPPSQSPVHFPSDTLYPQETSTSQQHRPKSYSLPNPTPLQRPHSFEDASVSRKIPSPELLAPPVKSKSFDDRLIGSSSKEAQPTRRRSSTSSNSGLVDGPTSDTSDGGESSERHETVTVSFEPAISLAFDGMKLTVAILYSRSFRSSPIFYARTRHGSNGMMKERVSSSLSIATSSEINYLESSGMVAHTLSSDSSTSVRF